MQLPWRRSFEEQMAAGVEREFEQYKRRCRELHEDFLRRMRLRDEARHDLSVVEEEIRDLQGRGVSLLGEMNSAMLEEDERVLRDVRSRHDAFSREIGRAQGRRDRISRNLAEIELDEREAARELMRAGQEQLKEAGARAEELKSYLDDLLDAQRREISEEAGLLAEEHESRGEEQEEQQGS